MILVTGPNGNVGTELVRALMAGELPYRVAEHSPGKIARIFGGQVPVARFDFNDRSTWAPALDGVDRLFLLFPLPHPRTARTWMAPFVAAAAKAGVGHIVYVSVPGSDRNKVVPHYTVERAIEASGVPYTFLRASFFSQNLCRDITTHAVDIATRNEIFVPAGAGRTSFVDSRDVAAVAQLILAEPAPHRAQAYMLTGPEALDYFEVAQIMTQVLGRPIRYARPSALAFVTRLWGRVTWDTLVFMSLVYGLTRGGKNAPLTDTLSRLLGRSPRTMRDFVTDYADRFSGEEAARAVKVATPGIMRATS